MTTHWRNRIWYRPVPRRRLRWQRVVGWAALALAAAVFAVLLCGCS